MNLKEFLEQNKIIKESALAMLMWPNKNNQAKVFSNKINEKVAGSGKQRITEDDEARAKIVLLELADRIKKYAVDIPPKEMMPIKKEITVIKESAVKKPVKKEAPKKFNLAEELEKLKGK